MGPGLILLMLLTLMTGTIITMSSTHWLLVWMGLEISTLALIPLMTFPYHHPRAVEAATKYFLIQACAASLIFLACVITASSTGQWFIHNQMPPLPKTIFIIALTLKLGLAPLHFWLPEVMQGVSLINAMIVATWQKIPAFYLLVNLHPFESDILIAVGLLSIVVGGLGGMNQLQIRKIMAYSSIAHMGWAVMILQKSAPIAILTMVLYITMTCTMFLILNFYAATTITSLSKLWINNPPLMKALILALLSLGGLPPLTGFMSKFLIMDELTASQLPILASIAALSGLTSLFFYLRMCHALAFVIIPNTSSAILGCRMPMRKSFPYLLLATLNTLTKALFILLPLFSSMCMMID